MSNLFYSILGYTISLIFLFLILILCYIIYHESRKTRVTKKRPEKLPFSKTDISTMNDRQFTLLGLKQTEVVDYLNRDVEKEKIQTVKKVEPVEPEMEPHFRLKRQLEPSRLEKKQEVKIEARSSRRDETPIYFEKDYERLQRSSHFLNDSHQDFDVPSSNFDLKFNLTQNIVFKVPEMTKQTFENRPSEIDTQHKKFQEFIKKYHITTSALTRYSENLRYWFHDVILKKVNSYIDSVNKKMANVTLDSFDCFAKLDASPSNEAFIPDNVQAPPSGKITIRQIIHSLIMNNKDQDVVQTLKNRIHLEEYLDLNCNRKYLIHRMKQLSEGAFLQRFKHDGGEAFEDVAWNERDFPTDTQIVFHLFCKFWDLLLPRNQYFGYQAFTEKYIMEQNTKHWASNGVCIVVCRKKHPPEFKIMLHSEEQEIETGRNNLFYTLALFLFLIQKHHDGQIEQRYLSDKEIGISRIFRE